MNKLKLWVVVPWLALMALVTVVAQGTHRQETPREDWIVADTLFANSPTPGHERFRARRALKVRLKFLFEHVCPRVPRPGTSGWGADDQAGNSNTQGNGTACRAGIVQALMAMHGKQYSLGRVFDAQYSPASPFGTPLDVTPSPTFCLEPPLFPYGTNFCGHSDVLSGDFGGQGTQLDLLGHAGLRASPTDPASSTVFYNGWSADDVQAGALGADQMKPINTIGILLDAEKLRGAPLGPTDVVTKSDVWQMMADQELDWLGFQPGMVVLIHTGYGRQWDASPSTYYLHGPGVAADVVRDIYLPNHIVLHALDNPFSDQADLTTGTFASGSDPLDPFPVHTSTLRGGSHQVQNALTEELAADGVYLFSVQLAPPRIYGAKGAMVNPIAFGAPW